MTPLIADTVRTAVHAIANAQAPDPPLGVYVSLAGLALTIAGIIWKGGLYVGEMRATRREHHKRLVDLEDAAKASAENRITRQELDARFAEMRGQLSAMNDRLADAVTLISEALKR